MAKLFSGNQFAGMFQKYAENLERLLLEPYFDPALAQFARPNVYFENAETKDLRKLRLEGHHVFD